jgi:hypothetical protein
MLTAFGTIAVATMFVSYWLEPRSRWFVLTFAASSAATALYSVLVAAYPITVVEALWAGVALRRFLARRRTELAGTANRENVPSTHD